MWSSSVNFFLVDRRNLDLKHFVDVEMSLETIGIKRFERFGVEIVQFDWIALECFRNTKNISIYRRFGRSRPTKRINGSDEMHDCESLSLSRGHWIAIKGSRWSHVDVRYKMHRSATYPLFLSEDQGPRFIARSDTPYAATSSPASTVWSRCDQTVQIMPRHLRVIKNLENQFLIRKSILNSKKILRHSLKIKKSLLIRKFITFKILLQINPNFFHLMRNLIIYHSKKSNLINNKRFNFYFKNTFIRLRF